MLNIMNKGAERVEVNALFIQPSYLCGGQCKGCFLREHVPNSPRIQIGLATFVQLLNEIKEGAKIHANQVTWSLNSPTNGESLDYNTHLLNHFASALPAEENHVTVQNHMVLDRYLQRCSQATIARLKDQRCTISLSNLGVLDGPLSYITQFKLNWNHVAPRMHQINERSIDLIKKVLSYVESYNIVLKKRAKGGPSTIVSHQDEVEWMVHYLDYVDYLKEHLTPEEWRKIHLDDCLLSVIKSMETGFGCSSGVSRFQIWPDGAVSGCAYRREAQTEPGETSNEIIENVRKARDEHPYDFHTCNLKAVYERALRQREQQNYRNRMDASLRE